MSAVGQLGELEPHSLASGPERRWSVLAWSLLAAIEAAVVLVAVLLARSPLSLPDLIQTYIPTNAWMAATFAPLGAAVAARRSHLNTGWLILGFSLLYGLSAAGLSTFVSWHPGGGIGTAVATVGWVASFLWTPAVSICLPLFLLSFPGGRLAARRWRPFIWLVVANGVAWAASWGFQPVPAGSPWPPPAPFPVPSFLGHAAQIYEPVGNVVVGVVVVVSVAALVYRWYRAEGISRAQLSWLVWGVVIAVILLAPEELGIGAVWAVLLIAGTTLLPVAATIAIFRHQLFDIDLVVNRTFVYVLLTGGVVSVYLAVTAAARWAIGGRFGPEGAIVAALLVAGAFAPARDRLQRAVNRYLFGQRRDPAAALTSVAESLTAAEDGLEAAVEALRIGLRLPALSIEVGGRTIGHPLASPEERASREGFDLVHQSEIISRLWAVPRRGQSRLDDRDRLVLRLACGPLAVAVRSLQLSEHLERSRLELVDARSDERQRLHRDLHDGLGPVLTALALKADAAGNIVGSKPLVAADLLRQISSGARDAIADVRRIAHELGPVSLATEGFRSSILRQASEFTQRLDGAPLRVTADLPVELPPLPERVQATAFRIVAEALANVARHATASRAYIRLSFIDVETLEIEVSDNGTSETPWRPGFGLASMQRRTVELGGDFAASGSQVGGNVRARLPLKPGGVTDQ
jgi:two-component system, NarL family, sensor kinase